ncbi:MAG: copper amine oxidase N-terminal domain-containing protein [Lachnospirales bacterium]
MKKYIGIILSLAIALSSVVSSFASLESEGADSNAVVTENKDSVATGSSVTTTTEATTEIFTEATTEATTEAITGVVTEVTTEITTVVETATETTTYPNRPRTPGTGHLRNNTSYVYTKYNVYTTSESTTEETTEEGTESVETNDNEYLTKNVKVQIGNNEVIIGSESYVVDAMPYIQYTTGSTLVPLRFVALAVSGGDVDTSEGDVVKWDAATKTAIVNYNGNTIAFTAGSSEMIVNSDVISMANGAVAEISGNRMYIPFRALGDALGVDVDWDSDTKTATYIIE